MPLLLSVPGLVDEGNKQEILGLLRVMLAQAINHQDRNLVAQLYETIRCLANLDEVITNHYNCIPLEIV